MQAADVKTTPPLTAVEEEEILKEIARDGSNAAATIAALRELRVRRAGSKPVDDHTAQLYEVSARRSGR